MHLDALHVVVGEHQAAAGEADPINRDLERNGLLYFDRARKAAGRSAGGCVANEHIWTFQGCTGRPGPVWRRTRLATASQQTTRTKNLSGDRHLAEAARGIEA